MDEVDFPITIETKSTSDSDEKDKCGIGEVLYLSKSATTDAWIYKLLVLDSSSNARELEEACFSMKILTPKTEILLQVGVL